MNKYEEFCEQRKLYDSVYHNLEIVARNRDTKDKKQNVYRQRACEKIYATGLFKSYEDFKAFMRGFYESLS